MVLSRHRTGRTNCDICNTRVDGDFQSNLEIFLAIGDISYCIFYAWLGCNGSLLLQMTSLSVRKAA